MCTWMASDDDFFVLRRFGKLGARVALYMQDQISALEEDLQIEDNLCRTAVKEESDSGTFRKDPRQLRQQIMNQLCIKLEQYRMDFDMIDPMIWITGMLMDAERFILDHSTLKARPVASDFQIRNVNRWLEASNGAISEKEIQYIRREEDLIPLVSKTKTPLRRFIDRFQIVRRIPCFRNRKVKMPETYTTYLTKLTCPS